MSNNHIVAVLWGSETGTAEMLAEQTASTLKENGFEAQPIDMEKINPEQMASYERILIITSTWGDGDPPTNAYDLWGALQQQQVDMSHVFFSVCALGDTAYYQFCKCGHDFDEFLEKQGAKRIHPLQECDIDYEAPHEQWLQGVISALKQSESQAVAS